MGYPSRVRSRSCDRLPRQAAALPQTLVAHLMRTEFVMSNAPAADVRRSALHGAETTVPPGGKAAAAGRGGKAAAAGRGGKAAAGRVGRSPVAKAVSRLGLVAR